MTKEKDNTEKQINKLVEFRQDIYENCFTRRKDVQFELVDARLLKSQINSFHVLSYSSAYTRRWQSAYAALEKGEQDKEWLSGYLSQHVPETEITFFSLDCTV
jgi:hypothetical protein